MATANVMKEPPNYATVKGDRKNLTQYIAALKLWAKVSGIEKKNQADCIKYHAFQTVPKYFEELDIKFGDTLSNEEDGLTKIITFLEEKYGVSQHSEIVRKLNDFYSCSRQKNEDLVKYTSRFEQTYEEVRRIKVSGNRDIVTYSSTALAVLLLRTANLTDVDHQIISRSLNFDETDEGEEKKIFEKTKAAVIAHQVTKTANHTALPSTSAPGNLATFLTEELDLDQGEQDETVDLVNEFKIWFTDRRKAGGGKSDRAGPSKFPPRNKKQRKCDYCLCDHPKWDHSCGCPCTKHTKDNCPNPDPEKKRKADLAEAEWRKRRQQTQTQRPQGTMVVHEAEAPAEARPQGTAPPTSFLSYLKHMESVEKTFVVSVKQMSDAVSPIPRAEFLMEMQRLDRMYLGQQEEVDKPEYEKPAPASSSTSYDGPDGLVLSPLGEVSLSGQSSNTAVTNTNSHSPHDTAHSLLTSRIFLESGNLLNHVTDTKQSTMVVDTASPSTIIGKDTFARLRATYPAAVSRSFVYEDSVKRFEFGGGEQTKSLVRVKIPVYIQDMKDNTTLVNVWVEVVNQEGVPFLLGGVSLDKVNATIRLGQQATITFNWQKNVDTFPLYRSQSGHYHLLFLPMSEDDDKEVTRDILDAVELSQKDAATLVHFTINTNSRYEMMDLITQPSSAEKVYINDMKTKLKPLNKKEVDKLHHFWGHIHPTKLEKIVKNSGAFDETTIKHIRDLENCEACRLESRRPPKPKSSAPKSTCFNHLLCIDLKENIRYKNSPPYIVYFIDSFTRFKAARFIANKKGETVVEALLHEWVKYFGQPKYIQTDRGKEFLNQHLQAFCNIHNIRMTTTASYTPNAAGLVERNHAVVDKMLEKMITQDESLKPEVALCWSIQASNCLDLVDGISPHTLVFGRNPQHPSLSDLGDPEQLQDISAKLSSQYSAMLQAREVFTSLEAQSAVKKALQARIYTDHTKIQVGEWIYYKTNVSRYWQGPIKVLTKDGKRLYCLKHGSPVVVNVDDVLLHKPESELGGEQLAEMHEKLLEKESESVASSDQSQDSDVLSELPDIEIIVEREQQDREATNQVQEIPKKSSTAKPAKIDLGNSMKCNTCHLLLSSKNVISHAEQKHGITGKRIRALAKFHTADSDSLFANSSNLQKGDILVTRQGQRITLVEVMENGNWMTQNTTTGLEEELDLISNVDLRYLGQLENLETTLASSSIISSSLGEVSISGQSSNVTSTNANSNLSHDDTDSDEEAITIKTPQGDTTFNVKQTKVFFAAEKEQEPEVTLVVNIPRSRHGEERCIAAKKKELRDFSDFNVYDIVDLPADTNTIGTEWVLVEKEDNKGNKVVKARLCARGDLEAGKHMIPTNAPTANKVTIKLLLVLAASQGYDVRTNDVRRAFLQTEDLARLVYVKPPVEAGLPSNKVWLLRRAIYGLIDASRAYFLRHARELKVLGFNPLQFDPATFVKTSKGKFKAAYASHVDDCLAVGDKETLDNTHNAMAKQLTYGEVQPIPARFLGMNISRNVNGDIVIDQKHYVDELEVPDMQQFKGLVKADVLPEKHQSMFRSLASKLNMLALSSRPDFSFAAKYLTSRYGKATKSDLTRAVKLINRAKAETTEMIIPNLGDMRDWLVIGISDASNKSANEIFSVGGHVIMLVNKTTEAAAVVHWSSKKITRVVSSSLAAETLALQQMTGTLFLVRQILEGLCGSQANRIPCLALTDSKNLWSCIHNISSCSDNRLQADVINIRQAIHDDQTIQEVRYIHSSQMLADCLTKQTNLTGQMLLNTVRTGTYTVPGGTALRDSTLTSVKTWDQLMSAEQQDEDREVLETRTPGPRSHFQPIS